jgi:hypothetical protein
MSRLFSYSIGHISRASKKRRARCAGFKLVVVSGRDERILPLVRAELELKRSSSSSSSSDSPLCPLCYLFKAVGSHQPTVEHKTNSVRVLMGACHRRGIHIDTIGFIDDMPPHMGAFLEGVELAAGDASLLATSPPPPHIFALSAYVSLTSNHQREIQLRPYVHCVKDIVVLGLPSGSRKARILESVRAKLIACGERVELVEWDSSGGEQWGGFVQSIVSALARNARYVLVKIVPDYNKLSKLKLFLSGKGRILFVRAAEFASENGIAGPAVADGTCHSGALVARVSADAATQEVLLACLTRVLHSNHHRLLRPDLGQHVEVAGGCSIWPPNESNKQAFNTWATNVWRDSKAQVHGIVQVYEALLKRRNKIIKLQRPSNSVVLTESIRTHISLNEAAGKPVGDQAHQAWSEDEQAIISRSAELLLSRKAAIRDKRSVTALMQLLRSGRVTSRERALEDVVDDVVRVIGQRSDATRNAVGLCSEIDSEWRLDASLREVIDEK